MPRRHAAPARRPVERRFFEGDAELVAPSLLGLLLVRGRRVGRIVEVEAYAGERDAASHAYRGRTARNATMYGPPGHLYVYFTYGMHYCANVVCREEGVASAVLLRALAPLDGLEEMRLLRPAAHRDSELCSGPARLCQAFGITRADDGADLVSGGGDLALWRDEASEAHEVNVGTRVGLSARAGNDAGRLWRYAIAGDDDVSRPRPNRRLTACATVVR